MKLLILDNYDSFTYNIVHAVRELGITPTVVRNDKITLPEIDEFDKIIISPGPGIPSKPVSCRSFCANMQARNRYWAYASGIRLSERTSARPWRILTTFITACRP